MTAREVSARRTALEKASGARVMVLSGVTGVGVKDVLRALQGMISAARAGAPSPRPSPVRGEGVVTA